MKTLYFCMIIMWLVNQRVSAQQKKNPVSVDFGLDLTSNDFSWSIAGNLAGANPNVLSEVSWKDLQGTAGAIGIEIPLFDRLYVSGNFSKSFTYSGKATDTDYTEDNRRNTVYKAELESKNGFFADYQLSLGYHFNISGVTLSPNFGYGGNTQFLYLSDSDFEILNSTYKVLWKGFIARLEIQKYIKKFNLIAAIGYQQVNYNAKANWNFIDEFKHPVSFTHIAKGYGTTGDLKLIYRTKSIICPFITAGFCYWSTGAGIDELYYTDGRIAKTRLNNVSHSGYNFGLGLKIELR